MSLTFSATLTLKHITKIIISYVKWIRPIHTVSGHTKQQQIKLNNKIKWNFWIIQSKCYEMLMKKVHFFWANLGKKSVEFINCYLRKKGGHIVRVK